MKDVPAQIPFADLWQNPRLRACSPGFSLVEVVLCLGVVSFCLVALLGLFATGINLSRNSVQGVRATHVMTRLLAQRIAQPSGSQAPGGNALALPSLTLAGDSVASGSPVYLDENGEILPTSVDAIYQLNFRVRIPTVTEKDTATGKVSRLWAVLSWPAGAPLARATGTYEVSYCHIIP